MIKEEQEKLRGKTIYDFTPEEQDKIVLESINKNSIRIQKYGVEIHRPLKGWTDESKAVRRMVILDYLAQGLSHHRIATELKRRWDVCDATAYSYIKDCADYLGKQVAEFSKHNYEIALHRVEAVAEDALSRNDNKTALRAFDMINRMQGLYEEKVKVEAEGTISFKFGDE
jgi:hypothetical protein